MENRYYRYAYELHLHTSPSPELARPSCDELVSLYTRAGYTRVFVTNRLPTLGALAEGAPSYKEQVRTLLLDYERMRRAAEGSELRVFFGAEYSYFGTDFLFYGLPGEWYMSHDEIPTLAPEEVLSLVRSFGAAVVQAHPMRESAEISHLRLFPNAVDGVEIHNCACPDFANQVAEHYAKCYGLAGVCGSDISSIDHPTLAKFITRGPIESERDLLSYLRCGRYRTKILRNPYLSGSSYDYPPFLNRI